MMKTPNEVRTLGIIHSGSNIINVIYENQSSKPVDFLYPEFQKKLNQSVTDEWILSEEVFWLNV